MPVSMMVQSLDSKELKEAGVSRAGEPGAPNTLWLCQLIPCSRQEACTAVPSKLELHLPPATPSPHPPHPTSRPGIWTGQGLGKSGQHWAVSVVGEPAHP